MQAGVLQGDVKDVLLLDVTPLTFGLETLGGRSDATHCAEYDDPNIEIAGVFDGSGQSNVRGNSCPSGRAEMAADNKSLGRFILDGIPRRRAEFHRWK